MFSLTRMCQLLFQFHFQLSSYCVLLFVKNLQFRVTSDKKTFLLMQLHVVNILLFKEIYFFAILINK